MAHIHESGEPHTHTREDGTVYTHTHEEESGHAHGHGHMHTHPKEETDRIRNRLAKSIGHLESIKRMVEDERDCTEILIQLAAVKSAINNTGKEILKSHLSHCVVDAINKGDYEELEELNHVIDLFIK